MQITVLYFARLREALGLAREDVEPPASVTNLGQLRTWLGGRGEPWLALFSVCSRCAWRWTRSSVATRRRCAMAPRSRFSHP